MASRMIHLRVADLLMDRTPGPDETAFVMGNIAPDSGAPNADRAALCRKRIRDRGKSAEEE